MKSRRRALLDSQRYGYEHRQRRRAALARLRDGDPCCRCGQPMYRTEQLHLDHDDDRPDRYLGLSHRKCNTAAGARKGNALRRAIAEPPPAHNPSRQW